MRLLICAGGTGGGVYPAMAILQAVAEQTDQTLWVGSKGGMEANLVTRHHVPFTEISAAGVHGVGLLALPANLIKLARGYFQSRRILREFQPDVLLFTGGYVAVPMALAAKNKHQILYVPDIEPGMALKALSRFADVIAVTDGKTSDYLPKGRKLVVTGYPTRADLTRIPLDAALGTFELTREMPVLLVIGGSKGAHSLNQAIFENLEPLLQQTQVLHLTGTADLAEAQLRKSALSSHLADRYQPYAYLHEEISAAFSCASLVISRAGASTLGELPFYGLPAILVPYPYAWRYQKVNADHLVEAGAAVIIENAALSTTLASTVGSLLTDKNSLPEMRNNMEGLYHPGAAQKIAQLIMDVAAKKQSDRSI